MSKLAFWLTWLVMLVGGLVAVIFMSWPRVAALALSLTMLAIAAAIGWSVRRRPFSHTWIVFIAPSLPPWIAWYEVHGNVIGPLYAWPFSLAVFAVPWFMRNRMSTD
ncbi:MAG: hypothetical protein GVY16_06300 [Planctomycetes bacterium]|nr:hypothetical protein [Planctomycetota bacterium]